MIDAAADTPVDAMTPEQEAVAWAKEQEHVSKDARRLLREYAVRWPVSVPALVKRLSWTPDRVFATLAELETSGLFRVRGAWCAPRPNQA